jgi:hypothetical protein
MGDPNLDDEKGYRDGEDAVAEGLEPAGLHR